ncbi:MAG TPA: hypothetical protein VLG93_08435 [Sulfuricaulis sp.]|nr:hypothetical protein [Sulfuricaulis sp.]
MKYLHEVSQKLLCELPRLAVRRRAGEFDAAVFAVLYFLHWQIASHGRQFASRRNKSDPRPDADEWLGVMETAKGEGLRQCLSGWMQRYQFRGVIDNVPAALLQWLRGAWPLILREDIPEPLEVLRMQARGCRAVTLLTEYPRLRRPVLNKPDAFAFFRHDLEHAWKFFHSPALRDGQCAFFAALEKAFDRGVFAPYLGDAGFTGKFHYLMSDMNTHPEHSRQYLRAILVEYYLRHEQKGRKQPLSAAVEEKMDQVLRAVEIPAPQQACA